MSKALSANVSAGLPGNSQPVWLLQLISILGVPLYLASRGFTDTSVSQSYDGGRIASHGIGSVSFQFDLRRGGGIGKVSNFALRLANDDYYSDAFLATDWLNASVEMRLIFADKTNPYWSNAVPIFKGFIDDIQADSRAIRIRVVDAWQKRHRDLLTRLIAIEDYSLAPPANLGKTIPLIYGNFMPPAIHKSGIAAQDIYVGHRDFIKGFVISSPSSDYPSLTEVLLCGHDLKTLNPYDQSPRMWNDSFLCWVNQISGGHSTSYSGGVYIATIQNLSVGPFQNQTVHLVPILDEQVGTTDGENCVNEEPEDWTTLNDGTQYVTYKFLKRGINEGGSSGMIPPCILAQFSLQGTQGNNALNYIISKAGELDKTGTIIYFGGNLTIVTNTSGWDFSNSNYEDIKIKFYYDQVGLPTVMFKIKNLFLLIFEGCGMSAITELFFSVRGRMYSWTRFGHIVGDLIEYPTGVIESLLRDELGVAEADIDIRSAGNIGFDVMDADFNILGFKVARQLLDTEKSDQIIKKLAFESYMGYVHTHDNKESCFRIAYNSNYWGVIDRADVLADKDGRPQIKLRLWSVETLRNAFHLKYKRNITTGDYEKLMFVASPEQSTYDPSYTNLPSSGNVYWDLCHTIYNKYQTILPWEYESDWIRTEVVAFTFLQKIIRHLTNEGQGVRYEAEWIMGLSGLVFEIGDQVVLSDDLILIPTIPSSHHWIVTGIKTNPDKCQVTLTAVVAIL